MPSFSCANRFVKSVPKASDAVFRVPYPYPAKETPPAMAGAPAGHNTVPHAANPPPPSPLPPMNSAIPRTNLDFMQKLK
jgi:hypothetical protein